MNPDLPPEEPEEALQEWLARSGLGVGAPNRPLDDATYTTPESLLQAVAEHYLTSGDFNGLPVGQSGGPATVAEGLIRNGLAQLVTHSDYMNFHIRPWVRSDTERQVEELSQVLAGTLDGCLYPTPAAMERLRPALTGRSFADRLTMGYGKLELSFFDLAAIERYRSDPAYTFEAGDFGFRISTAPEHAAGLAYEDLVLLEAGYAYDFPADYDGNQTLHRFWCASLHDLAGLPARDQQRLATDEIEKPSLHQHPVWWSHQMGIWDGSVGPFAKILGELRAINEIWTIAFDQPLFATVERPRGWSWVLRPTSGEWDDFVLTTDKLISDNIRVKALDAANAPVHDIDGRDLPKTATLSRLEGLLARANRNNPGGARQVRKIMGPLREVRKARQEPAHRLADTVLDQGVINRQRDLLRGVASSLDTIRAFVQSHPSVQEAGWQPPAHLEDNWLWL